MSIPVQPFPHLRMVYHYPDSVWYYSGADAPALEFIDMLTGVVLAPVMESEKKYYEADDMPRSEAVWLGYTDGKIVLVTSEGWDHKTRKGLIVEQECRDAAVSLAPGYYVVYLMDTGKPIQNDQGQLFSLSVDVFSLSVDGSTEGSFDVMGWSDRI